MVAGNIWLYYSIAGNYCKVILCFVDKCLPGWLDRFCHGNVAVLQDRKDLRHGLHILPPAVLPHTHLQKLQQFPRGTPFQISLHCMLHRNTPPFLWGLYPLNNLDYNPHNKFCQEKGAFLWFVLTVFGKLWKNEISPPISYGSTAASTAKPFAG